MGIELTTRYSLEGRFDLQAAEPLERDPKGRRRTELDYAKAKKLEEFMVLRILAELFKEEIIRDIHRHFHKGFYLEK